MGLWGARYNREQRLGIGLGDSVGVRSEPRRNPVAPRRRTFRRRVGIRAAHRGLRQRGEDHLANRRGSSLVAPGPTHPFDGREAADLLGSSQSSTSLGLEWWPHPSLALELRGSDGSTGRPFAEASRSPWRETSSTFARSETKGWAGAPARRSWAPSQPWGRWAEYSEYRWLHDANDTGTQSVVGVERGGATLPDFS